MKWNVPTTVFEFNATTIRVCRCVTKGLKRVLTHCFSFRIGSDEEQTRCLIDSAIKQNALRPGRVILSVPRYIAMSRFETFPASRPQEISQIVGIYVAREAAHSCAGAYTYDYQHIGFNKEGHALVQIFLLKKDRLLRYIRILSGVGIVPERVTLNTQGLSNWSSSIMVDDESGIFRCVSLLNIDDHVFDFNTFLAGKAIYSRTITFLKDGLPGLAKEIKVGLESSRRLLDFYRPDGPRLYVTGKVEDFDIGAFEDLLSYPVERFDPVDQLNARPAVRAALRDPGVSYASVIGLALDRGEDDIDVTPQELDAQLERTEKHELLRQFFVFMTVVLLLASFLVLRLLQLKEKMIAGRQERIQAVLALEKSSEKLKKEEVVSRVLSGNESVVETLGQLYRLTPGSVFLTDLMMDGGRVRSMTGWSRESVAVLDYLKVLKGVSVFRSASLAYLHQNNTGLDKKADFKIIF